MALLTRAEPTEGTHHATLHVLRPAAAMEDPALAASALVLAVEPGIAAVRVVRPDPVAIARASPVPSQACRTMTA